MLLCLANIAETLAQMFTFIYFKICCAYCRWQKNRRKLRRTTISFRHHPALRKGQSMKIIRNPATTQQIRRNASMRSYNAALPTGRRNLSSRSIRNDPRAPAPRGPPYRFDPRWDTQSLKVDLAAAAAADFYLLVKKRRTTLSTVSAKDAVSAHLRYQSGTGGGPAPPELKDTVKEIWDMLPRQFERIPSIYDDNAELLTGTEI
uniref:Uncharacterized protein n=1 Tax=Romanomermis culicivorax TaxID=13658 RepID=A0A915I4B3_ROMCU